jgi:hypothetical protein
MTERTAEKIANVTLGAAALGAAYIVVRTTVATDGDRPGGHGADGRAPGVADPGGAARLGSEPPTHDMMAA